MKDYYSDEKKEYKNKNKPSKVKLHKRFREY